MRSVDHLWRVLATGFCFAAFSTGGLVLGYLVIPLSHLLPGDAHRKRRRTRGLIHSTLRLFTGLMSRAGVVSFDCAAAAPLLRRSRGQVVVANHPSLIDVVVLISLMPHADCIVKQELWDNPFISGVLKAAGYIKNSGDMDKLISACGQSLDAGYSLIIFPEGTRTTPDTAMVLQRGAANIALRCKADLVPVYISCVPTTLTKNEKWYSIPAQKVRFLVRVHAPIFTADDGAAASSLAIQARHLTERLRCHYMKCKELETS